MPWFQGIDQWLLALLAGVFAILSAIIGAVIQREGLFFWQKTKTIRVRGDGIDRYRIMHDGAVEPAIHIYRYELQAGKITLRGRRVSMTGFATARNNDNLISEGNFVAEGSLHGTTALLQYEIIDDASGQNWKGTILLRISGIGGMHGFWMAEGFAEPGICALGSLQLERQ